ncbi:MAG: ArsR/SmtB family transcription factor [Acidimicrobiales bacterium]
MLRALGHPIRLGIIRRLAVESETRACDFAEAFQVRQPTVSGHLRVLREADLVTTRRCGTQICYSIRSDALTELAQLLNQLQPEPRPMARPAS